MNRKNLIIAMALTAPALIATGCGGVRENGLQTNDAALAEQQSVQPIYQHQHENAVDLEPVNIDIQAADSRDAENAEEMKLLPAIVEGSEMQPTVTESVVVQQETLPPDELNFYFETNQTDVKQDDYEQLIAHAQYLINHPQIKIKISAHTDQSGSMEYNQKLAQKRAESVARVLVEYGVDSGQIETVALGEQYAVSGFEHAIYDRRVELEYSVVTRLSENSF